MHGEPRQNLAAAQAAVRARLGTGGEGPRAGALGVHVLCGSGLGGGHVLRRPARRPGACRPPGGGYRRGSLRPRCRTEKGVVSTLAGGALASDLDLWHKLEITAVSTERAMN